MFKQLFTLLILVFVLLVITAGVFEFEGKARQQMETITILRGQNALQIAADLKAEGYIKSKLLFLLETAKSGNWKNLKAGEYDLKGLSPAEIVKKMAAGQTAAKTATIVPGWTLKDIQNDSKIAKLVDLGDLLNFKVNDFSNEFDFLKNAPPDADLEGYLFPDTYQLPQNPAAEDLIRLALENFDKKLNFDWRQKIVGQNKSTNEIVVMASMLEKEVKTLEDKKIVAGILWKRLNNKMPLQVDSAVLYANNDKFDKTVDSPYNTYKYAGLPAGPICNPGLESLEAAIEPLDSPYLYYLSATTGATIFSKTYAEHLSNIANYLDK
jgi:UPF0755 protein